MRRYLQEEDYVVAIAANSIELQSQLRAAGADLILLDLVLGHENGMDIARELVATLNLSVIIVSGRSELRDRVEGLEAGADDYLVKPVAPAELRARIRAVLRRRGQTPDTDSRLRAGSVTLDLMTRRLSCSDTGHEVHLTETETNILAELMRHQGRAISRSSLRPGKGWDPSDRSVDVHIGRIRHKLRETGIQTLLILPIRGQGYRLSIDQP